MAIASIVRGFLNGADVDTHVTLLGIGLFTLAVAVLRERRVIEKHIYVLVAPVSAEPALGDEG